MVLVYRFKTMKETFFFRRDYLLSPVPFTEISQCVLGITETIQDRMSGGKKDGAGVFKGRAKVKSVDQEELLGNLCETVLKAANLAKQVYLYF